MLRGKKNDGHHPLHHAKIRMVDEKMDVTALKASDEKTSN
jgi:hypothetical protein